MCKLPVGEEPHMWRTLADWSQQKFLYGNTTTKDERWVIASTTQQKYLTRAHLATEVLVHSDPSVVVVAKLLEYSVLYKLWTCSALLRLVSASQKNGRQKKTCSGCLSSANSVSATILMFQHITMHCFYQFLLMFSICTRILSLEHLFFAYFTHGPNTSASAQYDNIRGAWLTQEGCTITERKEGRNPY